MTESSHAPSGYLSDMTDRYQGLLTSEQLAQLAGAVVCGAGAGGVGGSTYTALARLGCCSFRIADCGSFDASNANRQVGCDSTTIGQNKADVVSQLIRDINPAADVTSYPDGVTLENLDDFLSGASIVIDGIDLYALPIKKALYDAARARELTVISTPILAFGAALAIFDPITGPTFDEHFGTPPESDDEKAYRRYLQRIAMGFFGILPKLDWATFAGRVYEGKCPSIGTSCMLSGSLGALAVLDVLSGTRRYPRVPETLHMDLAHQRVVRVGRFRRFVFKLRLIHQLLRIRSWSHRPRQSPVAKIRREGDNARIENRA